MICRIKINLKCYWNLLLNSRYLFKNFRDAKFYFSSHPFKGLSVKESTRQCRDAGDMGLIPVSWRSHARGNGNPFQYSCLEKFHGQRSLVGYSPWDCKELDMTYHAPPSWTNHLPPKHFQISHLELELSIWILRRHKTSVYNTLLPASTIHVHLTRHQLKT